MSTHFIQKKQDFCRAYPYGASCYLNQKLYFVGKPASFLESPEKIYKLPKTKIKQIYCDSTYCQKNFYLLPLSPEKNVGFYRSGFARIRNVCFVFESKMEPLEWPKDQIHQCKRLFFVVSKKKKDRVMQSQKQWIDFFHELQLPKPEITSYFRRIY
ncbi:MAG: hypothetical protein D6767_06870 [Candidatus Hydrogenedentota bacterium]|nr:MAG: hypothetical protein D6767_06870 [Candidatus Hydrogenedentota bacterium]